MTKPDDVKGKLYEDLHSLTAAVPKDDKIVILENFNFTAGTDCQTWKGVIEIYGISIATAMVSCYSGCVQSMSFLSQIVFRLRNRNKTRMHLFSGHWHPIDYYVFTRKRDRQNVLVPKAVWC